MRAIRVPEPRKPAKRRVPHMTFILGLHCSEGIVLFADTLESDGNTRRYRNKLESMHCWRDDGDWGVCWGGAGTSAIVDKFSDKLKQVLSDDHEPYKRFRIEEKIDMCLEYIRKEYPRDAISIVLGLCGSLAVKDKDGKFQSGVSDHYLYRAHSETACISPDNSYCVAGQDVTLASYLLGNTFTGSMDFAEAIRLGIFVTSGMKKYAEFVDGPITVVFHSHRTPGWFQVEQAKVDAIEADFSVADADATMAAYWAARYPEGGTAVRYADAIARLEEKIKRSTSQK